MDIHQIDEICWIKDSYPVPPTASAAEPSTTPIAAKTLDFVLHRNGTFADGTQGL